MKPKASARSLKHLLQMLRRYCLITPRPFPQIRQARSGFPFALSLGCLGTKSTGMKKADQAAKNNRFVKLRNLEG